MTEVLFFGQITKIWALRGTPTPSTTVRCKRLSEELERQGFSCAIRYCTTGDFAHNLRAIESSDVIVFHRVQFPMAKWPEPATEVFLHLASKAAKKITIFDLDDAIYLQHPLITEFFVARSDLVTVGSHQLESFARRWNDHVNLLPSPVDTELFNPSIREKKSGDVFVLGWHGAAYVQQQNLRLIIPALRKLARSYDIRLKLLGTMGNRKIQKTFEAIEGLKLDFGPSNWIPYDDLPRYLGDIDIGLSPLRDNLWSRSKCAMKALEYMAMSIPIVVSPVGEHAYIIRDGVNGLLAESDDGWFTSIKSLIEDDGLRKQIGSQGRQTVIRNYSVSKVARSFVTMIKKSLDK